MRYALAVLAVAVKHQAHGQCSTPKYRPGVDVLELHYDHAPDRDDGHSAALDRTIIDGTLKKKGCRSETFRDRLTPVAGTYGYKVRGPKPEKPDWFQEGSYKVMDEVFGDCGGYFDAHADWQATVKTVAKKWKNAARKGRNIFVKEGGPSEFTADVIRRVYSKYPHVDFNPKCRVTVVQHSEWNENNSDDGDLKYVKRNTNYVKITDANAYLQEFGKSFFNKFKKRALASSFADIWKVALDYYNEYEWGSNKGSKVVDASDSGELMKIMRLGKMSLTECMDEFF